MTAIALPRARRRRRRRPTREELGFMFMYGAWLTVFVGLAVVMAVRDLPEGEDAMVATECFGIASLGWQLSYFAPVARAIVRRWRGD